MIAALRNRMRIGRWFVVILLSLFLGWQGLPAGAQGENRAGVVVQFGDGRVATYCVRFSEPSITGLDLLMRTGLPVITEVGGLGVATCSIGGEGCAYPTQPCFCQCQGTDCAYWNYYHRVDNTWRYSVISASGYTVTDGAVDAWGWGDQIEPPLYTVDQICAEPVSAATDTPRPTPPGFTETEMPAPTTAPTLIANTQTTPTARVTDLSTPVASRLPSLPTNTPIPLPTALSGTPDALAGVAPQTDAGGYVLFAVVVVALGGWLVVARLRRNN
ncbi:MAG TPA: hypothetical protein VJG32_14115 [Anaerolineae bacterium]|nr:hypothetical protein [Anaerolineae bacterium]